MRYIEREASRLLVLSPEGNVLLLHLDPQNADPFWVTPGGGLDEGESHEAAAVRELYEEVGSDDLATHLANLLRDGPPFAPIRLPDSIG